MERRKLDPEDYAINCLRYLGMWSAPPPPPPHRPRPSSSPARPIPTGHTNVFAGSPITNQASPPSWQQHTGTSNPGSNKTTGKSIPYKTTTGGTQSPCAATHSSGLRQVVRSHHLPSCRPFRF